jgi:hypothetical protein
MTPNDTGPDKTTYTRLRIVLAATLLLSLALRFMVPGAVLFLFWFVLLLIAAVHLIVHLRAMKRVPFTAARYRFAIWCSHILFFLGFAFQVDGMDASYGRAPILFWLLLSSTDSVVPIFKTISLGSFILLPATWLLLESVPLPKKAPPRGQ